MALGRLVVGFITVIVGASLVPTLVTIINSATAQLAIVTGTNTDTGLLLTNTSNITLSTKTAQPTAVCSDLVVTNASSGNVIAAGNYSFNTADCNFILTDVQFNGTTGDAAYAFTYTNLEGTAGSSASLLDLTILFFSLGVMIAGVGLSVSGLVEYGLV